MFHPLKMTDMKALRHPLTLAILVLLFSSCFSSQGTLYSQEYDDYGYNNEYYNDDYYDDYDDYYGNNRGVSFNVFYNELRPHGRWINNGRYGRVWVPNAGRNFHPYATNGYWVMTDYGNTWVSDYSWGLGKLEKWRRLLRMGTHGSWHSYQCQHQYSRALLDISAQQVYVPP